MGLTQSLNEDEGAVIRNKVMYAKPFFWNFWKKAIQLFNFNTKRIRNHTCKHTLIKISIKLCSAAIDWEQQDSRT